MGSQTAMTSHFDIGWCVSESGVPRSAHLVCDVDRLVSTKMLVQANSGAGKSWALRRILEQSHGLVQQIVIDSDGEFSSLREKYDYVLASRRGGDTVADVRTAKLLAERLLELRVSAVLDISELDPSDRVRFVQIVFETMVEAPKKLWHPCLVVLDEAQVFAPEDRDASSAKAVAAFTTRGRKRGFGLIAATQRLSRLDKDVAAECQNRLIGRTSLDADMKRAGDDLGFDKARRLELRTLEDGQFYAFGPALSRTVTLAQVGSVKTTHPKAGSVASNVVPPPTAKIRALLPQLSDLPAEAEARQKTEADLKAEIVRLKHELKTSMQTIKQMPAPKPERVEVSILKDSHIAHLETAMKRLDASIPPLRAVLDECLSLMHQAQAKYWPPSKPIGPPVLKKPEVMTPRLRPQSEAVGLPDDRSLLPDGEPITGPEQRILDAISSLNEIGVDEPEDSAVAFMAKYSPSGGAYMNPRGRLRKRGLIEYRDNGRRLTLILTTAGRSVAAIPPQDISFETLQARVLGVLPGPESKLLAVLIKAWPKALTDEELGKRTDYAHTGGAFLNPKGRLRVLGLVDYPGKGQSRARDILFNSEAE